MKKKPYIIANWKMSVDGTSLNRFFSNWSLDDNLLAKVNIIICPSFVLLEQTKSLIGERSIQLGAQNIFWENQGAFTGEVSAKQLSDVGCRYVIVGHSERRQIFGENDEMVNKKVLLALQNKLSPIICLGENFEEKDAGLTKKVVEEKVRCCLADVHPSDMKKVIIAYEPTWAISTNPRNTEHLADSPEEVQVIHKFIRKVVEAIFDPKIAESLTIIYGGSVNPDNISGFVPMDDIDGVLPGSASREADSFKKIIQAYL